MTDDSALSIRNISRQQSIATADKGKQPIFCFNLIRAVAIVLVVLDHTAYTEDWSDCQIGWFLLMINSDAALFFMVSGALLLPVNVGYGKFLKRRLINLWSPFIFWSAVYALLNYFLIFDNPWYLEFQLKWMWIRPVILLLWFIPAITALYLFYPIISPWIRQASKRQLEYFLVLWFLAGLFPFLNLVIGGIDFSLTLLATFNSLIGFAVGGYYFSRFPLSKQSVRAKIIIVSTVIFAGFVLPAFFLQWIYRSDVGYAMGDEFAIAVIGNSCLLFIILSMVKSLGRFWNKIVNFVAVNSFGIYLCHGLFNQYIFLRFWPEVSLSWWNFPLVLLSSLLLTVLLKKIPVVGRYIIGVSQK